MEYTFGVSGRLLRNVLIMYDHQTNSEWSQLRGIALTGPMAGTRLRHLAANQMTWSEWRERFPHTLALAKPALSIDSYQGYYESSRTGVLAWTLRDPRLYRKERVIGVVVADAAIAYAYYTLRETPVVNDSFNGKQLLVAFVRSTESAGVFDRRLDGQTLTFVEIDGKGETIEDNETRSQWNKLTGQAVSGPLAGKALKKVPYTTAFWFGWSDHYPGTRLHAQEELIKASNPK